MSDLNSSIVLTNATNSTTVYYLEHHIIIFLNTWILAPQIIFGSGGNILNLIVLLNRSMRSRTNIIFAAMALSDLTVLLLSVPTVFFYLGPLMRSPLYRLHNHRVASLMNCFSATSIWLMTYATLERVQVIRCPFRASHRHVSARFLLSLAAIWMAALGLTHFKYLPGVSDCVSLLTALIYANTFLVVLGPLVICSLLNWKLVSALRLNNRSWSALDDSQAHNQALFHSRVRVERKVTVVVCVIISCFVICNVPGAIVFIYTEIANPTKSRTFRLIQSMCNTMTITGKVLNFVLFCLTSEHFRKLLKVRFSVETPRTRKNSCRSQKTTSIPLDMV